MGCVAIHFLLVMPFSRRYWLMSIGGTFNNKAGLEKGEVVLKESRANLQTDFIMSQGGRLFLSSQVCWGILC